MADHAATASRFSEIPGESDQQDEDQFSTNDDRLASDLYKDYSSQNQAFIQIFLALAGSGVGYGVDVRDAYAFFAKEKIDAGKLIKDPEYRAQLKKNAEHVYRWEGKAIEKGTSKLGEVLKCTKEAIEEVDATNKKLVELKEGTIKDYTPKLQNLYGLSKDEIDAITQRAKYAVQKDPNLSMRDLIQLEGQSMARDKIKAEVENEAKANNYTPIEKERAFKTKTAQYKVKFNERTEGIYNLEKGKHATLTGNCESKLKKILIVPPPASSTASRVVLKQASRPTATTQPSPFSSQSISKPRLFPKFKINFSLLKFTLPDISFPKISIPSIPLGNFGSFFSGGLKSLVGSGGGLSKAANTLLNLGASAIPPLRGFLAGFKGIDKLTGGMAGKFVNLVIMLLIGIAVGVPFLLVMSSSSMFSANTGSNPLVANYNDNYSLSWNEFNKEYFSVNSETLSLDFSPAKRGRNDREITWQQFEKDNLSPLKQYLSLEK